ncbi:PTS sugar transporter subunit IIA [Aurantiacibacter spongiae]|uniref:PTS sugar transporter subunit IIA n=1 Tax=Aurantiacibacter spongiae TaxID=2488860 RepID=A0A3N5CQQ2_9SPHN|nr:PTS sugar transporter subunit IIA [Aurantiacibacter spongiae]RPF71403.1 PTS sugar transporter subunit IIA [Aurantiacibacter spongiae]
MNAIFTMEPEAVAIAGAESKEDILNRLSDLFARAWSLDAGCVRERLQEREALGSTGFGRGVAIPHARLPDIERPLAALLRLRRPVAFDAADGLPVTLVFGLLSPDNAGAAHLHALAAISRLVRNESVHDALIDAPHADAIYGLLTNARDRDAA